MVLLKHLNTFPVITTNKWHVREISRQLRSRPHVGQNDYM